jgi:hypothetical protein
VRGTQVVSWPSALVTTHEDLPGVTYRGWETRVNRDPQHVEAEGVGGPVVRALLEARLPLAAEALVGPFLVGLGDEFLGLAHHVRGVGGRGGVDRGALADELALRRRAREVRVAPVEAARVPTRGVVHCADKTGTSISIRVPRQALNASYVM